MHITDLVVVVVLSTIDEELHTVIIAVNESLTLPTRTSRGFHTTIFLTPASYPFSYYHAEPEGAVAAASRAAAGLRSRAVGDVCGPRETGDGR